MSQQNPHQFQPQGPAAYDSPQPPPPGGPVSPGEPGAKPAKVRNTIAIVALAAAIAGFVFAVVEGAYILGWVLLPIAFVLSLVALFQRDKPKKMALAALIIVIVGTVAGAIAFMSSAARVIDDAFSGGEVTATAPVAPVAPGGDGQGGEAPAGVPAGEPAEADRGTRQNPHPLGTTLSNDDWQVTVNSVDLDANAKIAAENPFNDEPDAGHTYALVNLTLTYLGDDSSTPMAVTVSYVTSAGNVINEHDKSVVTPDELGYNELYTGASVTGNTALHIPKDDQGVLRLNLGLFGDDVFVALR